MSDYSERLAREIGKAIDAAEAILGEGVAAYPFIIGYLLGDCSEQDRDAINERLARLVEKS